MSNHSSFFPRVANRLSKSFRSLPPVYSLRRFRALGAASIRIGGARGMLEELSPRPASGWRDASPSPRDLDVDLGIIVPVYNEELFVGECLRSILAQGTESSLEVVAIDDGSTDGSPAILDELASGDSRLRVIHQENQGFSGARNRGLDLARGLSCS